MTPLAEYWLKANLFLLLFFGCYWLLLRRHTFLRLNRAYLAGTLLTSFIVPLLHIPGLSLGWLFQRLWSTNEPAVATVSFDTAGYVSEVTDLPEAPFLPAWPELLQWIVVAGAVLLLLRTGWRTLRLLRQIRQWPAERQSEYVAVYPPDAQTPTFSFFRYLVLNPADVFSATIWQHELGHIHQGHSFDVLLIEIVQAFCWPNPVLWGYRRALRETHEFLADRYATGDGTGMEFNPTQTANERDTYARFLVQYAFNLPADALTHPFSTKQANFPTLKQRIQMLYEQHTRPRALWKYALVLPLATALLAMTNAREASTSASQVHVEGVISGEDNNPLSGATISAGDGQSGSTTDSKGHFRLDAPAGTTLQISAIGYRDMALTLASDETETVVVDYRLIPLGADAPKTSGASTSPAAPVRVSGVVRADDDKPLAGATIEVKNSQRGTTTDANGRFRIDALGGSRLITKFAGFTSQETFIPANFSVMNVNLVLVPTSVNASVTTPAAAPYSVSRKQQGQVFTVVQQVPRFPGGQSKLFQFLGRTIRYPEEAVQKNVKGKVFVAFVVNADGRIDRIQVLKGIGAGCDEEAVRVVSLMPKWLPGRQNGRAVAVKYNLPINFQLSEGNKVGMAPVRNPSKPGLSFTADSVRVGRSQLTIHMPGSLKAYAMSKALWLINGKEATQEEVQLLAPNAIQSVDVIKGESALAQYGEEGRYGVIRVTSKQTEKKR